MKLLLVFLNTSKLDLYKFGQIPGNFLTMFPCGDEFKNCSCPDGKQALSTQAWLYQDLWVKWATLQMVEHYMTMLQDWTVQLIISFALGMFRHYLMVRNVLGQL